MRSSRHRFGGSPDGAQRHAIDSYLAYRTEKDLQVFHRCATKEEHSPRYYVCFVADYDKNGRIHMRIKSLAKPSANARRATWPE